MLADGTEARVRAGRPNNEEELREIVDSAIEYVQASGQLDHTQLTLSDIKKIDESPSPPCAARSIRASNTQRQKSHPLRKIPTIPHNDSNP